MNFAYLTHGNVFSTFCTNIIVSYLADSRLNSKAVGAKASLQHMQQGLLGSNDAIRLFEEVLTVCLAKNK